MLGPEETKEEVVRWGGAKQKVSDVKSLLKEASEKIASVEAELLWLRENVIDAKTPDASSKDKPEKYVATPAFVGGGGGGPKRARKSKKSQTS